MGSSLSFGFNKNNLYFIITCAYTKFKLAIFINLLDHYAKGTLSHKASTVLTPSFRAPKPHTEIFIPPFTLVTSSLSILEVIVLDVDSPQFHQVIFNLHH